MMSFEEFREIADNINWKHRNDPESQEHIEALMRLYSNYGNVRVCNLSEQSEAIPREDDSRDSTARDNESDETDPG